MKVICQYCGGRAEFLASSESIYAGKNNGPLWICWPCKAWVGCHPGGNLPMGTLANHRLRGKRLAAHAAFDFLWRGHKTQQRRTIAYVWLSKKIGVPDRECHIGMFDEMQCEAVISACADRRRAMREVNKEQKRWMKVLELAQRTPV